MLKLKMMAAAMVVASGMLATLVMGASPKKYQVTGVVLAVTKEVVTVQKGDEKWEVGLNGDTKVEGELKVGSKVTIEYTMVAANVEVKGKGEGATTKKGK